MFETAKIFKQKGYAYQFLPRIYDYLTKQKIIKYKNVNLKTDYLINMMHEMILKFLFTNDIKFNLWSLILRKKYGKTYNIYINYLIEKKFIFLVSKHFAGLKAKTYKLNIIDLDLIRCKVTDKTLLKKYNQEYLERSFLEYTSSPIPFDLRHKLVTDLYSVKIDYNKANNYLQEIREREDDLVKFYKNQSSIDSINTGHIFFKFDAYGRMHTNFTILKKHIRKEYIKIDGEEVDEIDVKNSQPFFFSVLLKKEIGVENFNSEVQRYCDIVKNGLIYDELAEKCEITRDEAKMLVYKVLFGNNKDSKKENKCFMLAYPTIYQYIVDFKDEKKSKSYKELSHRLQLMESKFIFGVVEKIKEKIPNIKLFTVHDSITFPKKYKAEIETIFNYEFNLL
jgi:hypothetical protein